MPLHMAILSSKCVRMTCLSSAAKDDRGIAKNVPSVLDRAKARYIRKRATCPARLEMSRNLFESENLRIDAM
jgi:hypothetical protein